MLTHGQPRPLARPFLAKGQEAKEFSQVAKETVEPKRIWQGSTGKMIRRRLGPCDKEKHTQGMV